GLQHHRGAFTRGGDQAGQGLPGDQGRRAGRRLRNLQRDVVPAFYGRREGDRVVIEGADARHLARSLRARPGEKIDVVDPDGWMLSVRLDSISDAKIEGTVASERKHAPEPERHVVLAIAFLPSTTLELVLSRCTEVGASAFHIVQAHRSVARGPRHDRWQTIVREASMLAARLRVPIVAGPAPLDDV